MVNEIFGANIRKYRLAFNWTQEKFADTLCVSHQIISKWENGIATPDIVTLYYLSRIFNVSLGDLCGIYKFLKRLKNTEGALPPFISIQ